VGRDSFQSHWTSAKMTTVTGKPRAAADSLSRRHVLAGAGALAATGLLPCYEAPAQGGRANVIDTHHHFYPPDYHKAWSQ
jgi:hypothetical protein